MNWQSFDVGSQQSVSSSSHRSQRDDAEPGNRSEPVANRRTINANGQVILINQYGVTFYKGAQVNAAGLVVSAAGITNAELHGRRAWRSTRPAQPNARVGEPGQHHGRSETGLAALVAPQVVNSGVINARLGHVVLAGAGPPRSTSMVTGCCRSTSPGR